MKRDAVLARTVGLLGLVLIAVACGIELAKLDEAGAATSYFSDRRLTDQPSHSKQIGEDCAGGREECASSLCIHIKPDPQLGYFCTRACKVDSDCPAMWRCVAPHPDRAVVPPACAPPASWTAAVAD